MTSPAKNPAETQFEAYLAERGIAGGEDHHPELGADKKPDYRINRDGPPAIVELKGCEVSRMQERLHGSRGAMMLSDDDVYGTARNTIKKASRQLRPYAGRGEALIVAVANPKKIWTPTEDAQETIAVLHGNPAFSVPISIASGEAAAGGESICAEDGVFGGGLHRYVSGVLTLHERTNARDAVERWHEENRPRWELVADRQEQMVVYLSRPATERSKRPKLCPAVTVSCACSRRSALPKAPTRRRCRAISSMAPLMSSGPSTPPTARSNASGRTVRPASDSPG
jgi:hypothetical protein